MEFNESSLIKPIYIHQEFNITKFSYDNISQNYDEAIEPTNIISQNYNEAIEPTNIIFQTDWYSPKLNKKIKIVKEYNERRNIRLSFTPPPDKHADPLLSMLNKIDETFELTKTSKDDKEELKNYGIDLIYDNKRNIYQIGGINTSNISTEKIDEIQYESLINLLN